ARWLAGSGMYALVAPSGTGELFSLTPDECAAIVRATVEAAAGRIPVIAGVGFGPRVAAELARQAERDGADGILVLPPYYAHPDPDGLVGYYRQIAEATLGLYRLARAADYRRLAQFHEHVVRPFYDLRQRRRGFEVAVMKVAMELLGHPAGPVRPPLGDLSADEREEVRLILERLSVPTAASRRGPMHAA